MVLEGEFYDLGGVPEPQVEEPRQWAAFRQAVVMRKMGASSEQWQPPSPSSIIERMSQKKSRCPDFGQPEGGCRH